MANLCGVDQKMLAEVLSQIAKVGRPLSFSFYIYFLTSVQMLTQNTIFKLQETDTKEQDEPNGPEIGIYQDRSSITHPSGKRCVI